MFDLSVCVFRFALGGSRGPGGGGAPVTLPGYQGCCGARLAALWRVVAPVSASLVASPAYRAPVVERVRAAERPGRDVVGFGAVGLQAGPPCKRDATCGAGGLSGGAVAFEDGCAPALVSGGSGSTGGHGGWGGGCWRGGWFAVPPPAGVVRRGGHLARGRWWPGLGGWGGGCWRAHRARGRGGVP